MSDRKNPQDRRRSSAKRARSEEGEPPAKPRKPEPPPAPAPDPSAAVDRDVIAAREAGIYDEESSSPAPAAPRRRNRRRPEREKRRRRPSSKSPTPPPAPDPEPEKQPETIDWLEEIEDEVKSARADEESRPEPRETAKEEPEEKPPPAEEPEEVAEEVDGFAIGIFAEEAEATSPPLEEEAPAEAEAEAEPQEEAPTEEPAPTETVPAEPPSSPDRADRWTRDTWAKAVERHPERKGEFLTSSDIPLAPLYSPRFESATDHDDRVGYPGEFPFTRGVQATMYRGRFWTMRQYAGFASAKATNERFKYLLAQGQTGLSVAFDLPTQIGYSSSDQKADGEVGKVGVPINSLRDMEVLLDGIPLDQVSLSLTINSTALITLLMVAAVARKQGVPLSEVRGTVQNDMLKEFVARNTYRFPLDAHLKLVTDLFRYSTKNLPKFNLISVSGYHMREAGCTAVQEVAFTLANAIAYVEQAVAAGLDVDDFAGRLSFFFASHNHLLEEVAKFRAARRMWAKIMKERFGAKDPKAMMLRFHCQTAGSTLTATQPEANIVRVTLQALSAVLGGTQSLHTNSWDEALGLPSERAALLALRTQQIVAHESGVTDVVDPLGGSPLIEELTDAVEEAATEYLAKIDEMGGAVQAVRSGWMTAEIEQAAYRAQQDIESGDQVVVGVNRYAVEKEPDSEPLAIDQAQVDQVLADLEALMAERNNRKAQAALASLEISAAWGDAELPELLLDCVESYCTIGEMCGRLESVHGWGED